MNPTRSLLPTLCTLALASGAAFAHNHEGAAQPHPTVNPATTHAEHAAAHTGHVAGAHADGMHHGMHCMKTTGDADADFALHLRHHQLRAVEIARAELANGDDPAMRARAQAFLDAHTGELAALDAWLAAARVDVAAHAMACDKHDMHGMHAGTPMHTFDDLDRNDDGFLDHAELGDTHPLHKHFEMADGDRDGRLSRAEITRMHADMRTGEVAPRLTAAPHPRPPGTSSFAALDDNHDGFLMHAELAATDMLHMHFDAADTNDDGKLSEAEVGAHHVQMNAAGEH